MSWIWTGSILTYILRESEKSNRSGYLDVVPKFGEGMTDIPDVSA